MKFKSAKSIFLSLASLLILSLSSTVQAQSEEEKIYMPEWELKTADGQVVKSTDLLGKPVILHFWATWCPYCKRLQPAFDRLKEKYEEQGLQIWAISFNESKGAKPQEMLNKRGHTFKTLVDGDRVAIGMFEVNATPTTFFYYADGSLMGMTQMSDPENPGLEQAVEHLLADMKEKQAKGGQKDMSGATE